MEKISSVKKQRGAYFYLFMETKEVNTPTSLTVKDITTDPNGVPLVVENRNDAQMADLIQTMLTLYNDSLASRNLPLFTPVVPPVTP